MTRPTLPIVTTDPGAVIRRLASGQVRRVAGAVALVLGVFLMHGLSGPNMSHDGLPGLGYSAEPMSAMKSAASNHDRPDGSAMLTMTCVFAVLQLTSLAARRTTAKGEPRLTTAFRVPIGPLRGPEPPVPRFV